MPFVFDDQQPQAKRDEFGGVILEKDQFGGYVLPDGQQHGFVFDDVQPRKTDEFGGVILSDAGQQHGFVFDDGIQPKPRSRTWLQAAGDTAVDLGKGIVGVGESAVGLADLASGNLAGKGLAAVGYDSERTKQILSELHSDARQEVDRKIADTKGFWNTTKALIDNPSAIVGGIAESAPMMLGSVGAVRTVAMKMLASNGLVAGTAGAAAFLSQPAVVARLTAVGAAAEGATTTGNIQEQGRAAGRDYTDTAPSAVAAGAITGLIGVVSSKIPGLHDAEVGAAVAGLSGASKRAGLISAGKEIAKGTFKEGVLEELPQSAQEQVWTNLAMGKPWDEGVAEAGAQGMVIGAGQGGGMNMYSAGRNGMARSVTPAAVPGAGVATENVDATSAPGGDPAPTQTRAVNPETRLAELDLLGQTRDLTAQEQGEFTTLARAMDDKGPSMDAQAPVFEDVPDFAHNQPLAPVVPAQAATNSIAIKATAPVLTDPVTGEPVAPTDARYPYVVQAHGDTAPQAARDFVAQQQSQASPEQQSPRNSWDGFKNGDRVQSNTGTTGTLRFGPGRVEAYLVHDKNDNGTPNVEKSRFSVLPNEVQKIPGQVAAAPSLTWFGFLKEKGIAPGSILKATHEYYTLREEFDARKAGTSAPQTVAAPVVQSTPQFVPDAPGSQSVDASPTITQPVNTPLAPPQAAQTLDLQNRDRSRAASVMQMTSIANAPDYGRLGTSRTPDSGAPMVFPVGDDGYKIPEANYGNKDVAVMADGQRVPFVYAVVDASTVDASHFADGRVNPSFDAGVNGTLKALNNGRAAGLRAAHEQGTAGRYVIDMARDAANTGVSVEAIQRTPNPILVRAYQDASNTPNMAAKSQGQGLGMSPGELARQDAPLMDATVLTMHRPGDVASAANRDFVRAFVGKLVQTGQDVASMMTGQGTLSPAGRTRIQAALVQAAYGDSELVGEMFDSQDTDIKAIGEALKTVAGQWADMRDSARMGAIDAHVDISDNLVQAVNLIRKARSERMSLVDLVNQPDLMTGEAPAPLTTALLRVFYSGQYLTRALGREQIISKLHAYTQAAMSSSHGADMFGQQVTVEQILATITNQGGFHDNTQPTQTRTGAAGVSDIGGNPDAGRRLVSEGGPSSGENGAGQRQAGHSQIQTGSNQADQGAQAAAVNGEPAFSRSTQGAKNGFKGWPKFNAWTRKQYEQVVSYLPAEYRNDPHRREPIATKDWDVLAAAVLPELDALNAKIGEGTFRLDGLGNILASENKDGRTFIDEAIKIADKHDLGIYITNVRVESMRSLQDLGFTGEMGLGAILQRETGSNQAPRPLPDSVYRKVPGTIMSRKPRGFAAAMFSRGGESPADLLASYDRTDALAKQSAETDALKQEQKPAPKPAQKQVTADQVDLFNPQGSLFARRTSVAKSLPLKQVQSIVDAIRSQWANAPDVVVVAAGMDDAAVPAEVRDYDQKQRLHGATGSPDGFVNGGKVYMLADQLATPSDVIRVLFHESLGHLGLRGVFGDALNPILDQIIAARRAEVVAKAKQYGLDMTKPEDALTAAEEVLATLAQDKPELGFVKRAVAAIRTWLRANVPGFKDLELTNAEIINSFILPARAFVQQGRSVAVSGPLAFRRAEKVGSLAFAKWFGSSKVVNAAGQPLVVYHGTTRDFSEFKSKGVEHINGEAQAALGFFFTNATDYADGYLEHPEIAGAFADGAQVMPVYLALRNPKVYPISKIQQIEDSWSLAQGKRLRAELERKGHDGIIFKSDTGNNEYVVFTSNQAKSATGNNGNFDAANPDIRFSRNTLGNTLPAPIALAQVNAWTAVKNRVMRLTSPENIDKLIYEFQDKHIDLKRVQAHIKELGGTITDLNDAYLGEELFHKRLAKRTEDFLADELKPLLVQMKASDVTLEEFESFLHARHAPEANAALAKRNPNRSELDVIKTKASNDVKALELKMQHAKAAGSSTVAIATALDDAKAEARKWFGAQAYQGSEDKRLSLSGMSDSDAAALMAGLDPIKGRQLKALAGMVDAINSKTLDLLEKYGLMDRASISAWRNAYEHYVPLHRDEAQAEGSSHPVGMGFSVKGNAAKQRTGSNEKVTHILGHIAMQREAALTRGEKNHVAKKLYLLAAQNPDKDVWSVDTPPMTKSIDQNTGIVRLGVDPMYKNRPNVLMVRIAGKDVAIVFNEDNPQAVRLVGALKNLDVGDLHVVLGLAAKGTRWFASVNTQYNPIFGLVNFARDFQESMVNLSTTPIAGKQLELAKGVPAAMRAIYRQERGKGAAGAENARWVKLWDEMQDVGGATGYRDMYANAADRVDALTKQIKALDRGEVSQAAHAVADWLSHYNESMENAVRLSSYKVALDSGMTKERAASLSKNLTVNFNRKGKQTREIGALYAFFNASMQGTARMAETLKGPMGKRIMLGGVTLGVINGLVGMTLMGGGGNGDDDEWAKIPDFIKENSLIIPISGKDYLTIPMPLGFKVFPNIGRLAVEFALGGPDKTAGKQLGKMLSVLVDAFNPLGGTQNLGQMVAPTVIDPVVALMQNRDWTGRPIYRENNSPLSPQPGTKMVKNSASTAGKGLATAINAITGGSEYRPGAWSPTPDQIDYVFGQLTGGLGRELLKANQVITAPFTGDEVPAYKIPLVGRLYGNTNGPAAHSEQFYENVKKLNEIEAEIKGRARHGEDTQAYRDSEPLSGLVGAGNGYELLVSRLRKNRGIVVERASPGYQGQVKEIDKQIGEAMANLNRQVAKAQRQERTQ